MRILLVNDDGYEAKGINHLRETLYTLGHEVTMVAPLDDQSGRGQGINYRTPRTVTKVEHGYAVEGTPADCVRVGLWLLDSVDMVISGINNGSNIGTDYRYSGTVGACMEGAMMGVDGLALSLSASHGEYDYSRCSDHVTYLLPLFDKYCKERRGAGGRGRLHGIGYVWNVNMPSKLTETFRYVTVPPVHRYYRVGLKLCQGEDKHAKTFRVEEEFIRSIPPDWGLPDDGYGSDHHMLRKGNVVVVPLTLDEYEADEGKYIEALLDASG